LGDSVKVLLHFVGKSTYDEKLFKIEAKKYGVNRALPPDLALKLKPGDIVLLAFKDNEGARVFGYMVVEGYTLGEEILSQLSNIVCHDINTVEERGMWHKYTLLECATRSRTGTRWSRTLRK